MYSRSQISGYVVVYLQHLEQHPKLRHNRFFSLNLRQDTLQNIERLKGNQNFLECLVKKDRGVGNCFCWTCVVPLDDEE
jgi:hypothetical protein